MPLTAQDPFAQFSFVLDPVSRGAILGLARRGASSPRKGPCPPIVVPYVRSFFQPDWADSRQR